MTTKKKHPDAVRENKIRNQAKRGVLGFKELLARFERTVSVLCRSQSSAITIPAMWLLSRSILVKSPLS